MKYDFDQVNNKNENNKYDLHIGYLPYDRNVDRNFNSAEFDEKLDINVMGACTPYQNGWLFHEMNWWPGNDTNLHEHITFTFHAVKIDGEWKVKFMPNIIGEEDTSTHFPYNMDMELMAKIANVCKMRAEMLGESNTPKGE